MVELHIGRHGVIILVILFVILTVEDVFVWINSGVVPGIEFFVGAVLVVAIIGFAIQEGMTYRPPGNR